MLKPTPAMARPSDTAPTTTCQRVLAASSRNRYEPASQDSMTAVFRYMAGTSRLLLPVVAKYASTSPCSWREKAVLG